MGAASRTDGGFERERSTVAVSSIMGQVRQDIVSRATPEQLERMRKAEAARGVYRAWNAVCGGTREGEHVTGLRYLSDQNKLLVYLDDAVWTQEMTMLREIIRARMEREGVRLDGFVFRTTKPGFKRPGVERPRGEKKAAPTPPSTAPLSPEEEGAIDAAVAPIADDRLRKSLKKAMKASMEWKKGTDLKNKA